MELDEFRAFLSKSGVDIWSLLDTAIQVASSDYEHELKARRDGIVERLFACRKCSDKVSDAGGNVVEQVMQEDDDKDKIQHSPHSVHRDDDNDDVDVDIGNDDELDPYGGLFDDEEARILRIKEQIEDPHQTEDALVELLQGLDDMDITFKGLKETDIGRYVNRLRKHPSNEVKRLVKQLVRKWKDLVDEWVKSNPPEPPSSTIMEAAAADGESPMAMRRNLQNGHHQVPDFAYSPNPNNGSSGSERNNSETEHKPKPISRREPPAKSSYQSTPGSASVPPLNRPHKETTIDPDRLASARRRLQENYQEAQNAKKQRTIQVMDIHEIPKPKNGYIARNKGGLHGRNHR